MRAVEVAGLVLLVVVLTVLAGLLLSGIFQMGGDPSCALQGVC